MQTDLNHISDYFDNFNQPKTNLINLVLVDVNPDAIRSFLKDVKYPTNRLQADLRAHSDIPNTRQQQQYLQKCQKKFTQFCSFLTEMIELIEGTADSTDHHGRIVKGKLGLPFSIKHDAKKHGINTTVLQFQLLTLQQLINEYEPTKTKFRVETEYAIAKMATAFTEAFSTPPTLKSYRDINFNEIDWATTPLAQRFVPLVSILIDREPDSAYRLVKNFFAS